MSKGSQKDDFTDEEAQRRFEVTLKGALKTPPKPHKKREPGEPDSRPNSQKEADQGNDGPEARR